MAERFPLTDVPPAVSAIARKLIAAGHEAWYVGGAVRDAFIRRTTHHALRTVGDYDIATSATPQDVLKLFRRTVPVGIEHGTVAVLDDENRGHEVTTFRKDVKTDGRHAEVSFGVSLDEDLERRDFTINAIAVHPESGDVRDPFKGHDDLVAGVVRAVREPAQRFREDWLRVLRGLRFAATFGFTIEPATWDAIRASAGELGFLSRERVRDEWLKMLNAASASAGIGLWQRAGVLGEVWPLLKDLPGESLAWLDIEPRDGVLVTAGAFAHAGVSPEAAAYAVRQMRFSNEDVDRVEAVVEAMRSTLPKPDHGPALRRWLAVHRDVAADALRCVKPSAERDALRAAVFGVLESNAALSIGDLAVTGDDLKAAGIPAGPQMGVTLRRLLDAVLEDPARNTRDALLALAREGGR